MVVRLLPDAEILLVAALKASADVTAIAGTRVGTELYAGTDPAVWLTLVTGGETFRNHLVAPVVDVRSYGGSKAQASTLARTCHAVLLTELMGVHAQGIVTAVETLTLPAWSPDEGFTPPRPRYIGSYLVRCHPHPS